MIEATFESGDAELRRAILRSNQDPIPRNIVLQVCLVSRGAEAYVQRLYREIEIIAPLLARDRRVVRLNFEGDAPATPNMELWKDLLQSLAQHFALAGRAVLPAGASDPSAAEDPPEDCDVLGLGVGAVSRFGRTLTTNATDVAAYCRALDAGQLPVSTARSDASED